MWAIVLFLTPLVAATRRHYSATGLRIDTTQRVPSASHKEVTYVRHGESVGNAGFWGAIGKGSATAYRDGTLTVLGKKQVVDRVELMDQGTLDRILAAEVVMTSPLRRAMGTAVLLMAHAEHKKLKLSGGPSGNCGKDGEGIKLPDGHSWPTFAVVAEMREKVKTHSETPGSGDDGDPMIYIRRTGKKAGERLFCDENAMDSVVQSIVESYSQEKSRTTDENGQPWHKHHENVPLPEDGYTFVRMIQAFKRQVLPKRSESRILMVGHSGWSRFAFAPFMVRKQGQNKSDVLAHGMLEIKPLKNAGVLKLQFLSEAAEFRYDPDSRPDPEGILPGSKDFPNFGKKYKEVLLSSLSEAASADAVPADATGDISQADKIGDFSGFRNERIFMLSSSKSLKKAYIAWFDKWGDPLGHAQVCQGNMSFEAEPERRRLDLMMVDGKGKERDSVLEFESTEAYVAFKTKLEQHRDMFPAA